MLRIVSRSHRHRRLFILLWTRDELGAAFQAFFYLGSANVFFIGVNVGQQKRSIVVLIRNKRNFRVGLHNYSLWYFVLVFLALIQCYDTWVFLFGRNHGAAQKVGHDKMYKL